MDQDQKALDLHKKLQGKITTALRGDVTEDTLKLFYSPGVGAASLYAQQSTANTREVTWTNNLVAVISDGSAVLGLGDLGAEGSLPVMEGKSLLFKHFAGIDSVPIVLDVHTVDEIVDTIKAIAPSFGGINLEDIAAPKCFEIEERLKAELDIPVMHDDQHGTAIVVLAGLINAEKITGVPIRDRKIVMAGAGAAGVATAKLLHTYVQKDLENLRKEGKDEGQTGGPRIFMVDSKGIISKNRTDLNDTKKGLLKFSNLSDIDGSLEDIIEGADTFIGVSQAGLLTEGMVKSMDHRSSVIFALANPVPEIMPVIAKAAGAKIVATGRSDFPNQVNNVLGFPGIFRGALDNGVKKITDDHKIAAAEALAALVESPTPEKIIPGPFDEGVVEAVAAVIQ